MEKDLSNDAEVGWHSWRAAYIPGFTSLRVMLMMASKSLFFSNLFLNVSAIFLKVEC